MLLQSVDPQHLLIQFFVDLPHLYFHFLLLHLYLIHSRAQLCQVILHYFALLVGTVDLLGLHQQFILQVFF